MTNIKSTTSFPTSYRWSAYVTPKSGKGGSKSDLFIFWIKSQLHSNKVTLYENFRRQSCTTIPVSNGLQTLMRALTLQPKI